MDIQKDQRDQVVVVSITGSIDAFTASEVTNYLSAEISAGHNRVVADLSHVDYISSAGLRAILSALKETRQMGGDFRLAGAQPNVSKLLHISGFVSIIKIFSTVDDAVASFAG